MGSWRCSIFIAISISRACISFNFQNENNTNNYPAHYSHASQNNSPYQLPKFFSHTLPNPLQLDFGMHPFTETTLTRSPVRCQTQQLLVIFPDVPAAFDIVGHSCPHRTLQFLVWNTLFAHPHSWIYHRFSAHHFVVCLLATFSHHLLSKTI